MAAIYGLGNKSGLSVIHPVAPIAAVVSLSYRCTADVPLTGGGGVGQEPPHAQSSGHSASDLENPPLT
jgi:hypothetical protein